MNKSIKTTAGFCCVQKDVVSTSKAASMMAPSTPDFFEGLDDKTIANLCRYFD